MNKLKLTNQIPPDYNRQAWFRILTEIETIVNRLVDGYLFPVTSVTSAYTANVNDSFIVVDATSGAVTITLPPAAEASKKRLTIKKIDVSANAVTIDGNGSETIDDSATQSLASQYDYMSVMSDGTEWWIV